MCSLTPKRAMAVLNSSITLPANTAPEPSAASRTDSGNMLPSVGCHHRSAARMSPRRWWRTASASNGETHSGYESQVHDRCRDPQFHRRRFLPGTGRQERPNRLDALGQSIGAVDQLAHRPPRRGRRRRLVDAARLAGLGPMHLHREKRPQRGELLAHRRRGRHAVVSRPHTAAAVTPAPPVVSARCITGRSTRSAIGPKASPSVPHRTIWLQIE